MLQVKKVQVKVPDMGVRYTFRQVNVMRLNEKEVAKSIAAGGTYSVGESTGVLTDFGQHLAQLLANNNKIEIEGLGTFELSTKAGSTEAKEDLKKSSIKLGINFTPSADVMDVITKAEIKVVQTATVETEEDEDTPSNPQSPQTPSTDERE